MRELTYKESDVIIDKIQADILKEVQGEDATREEINEHHLEEAKVGLL